MVHAPVCEGHHNARERGTFFSSFVSTTYLQVLYIPIYSYILFDLLKIDFSFGRYKGRGEGFRHNGQTPLSVKKIDLLVFPYFT